MNKNDLYNAISGINKDYIEESENFDVISDEFRKVKNKKKRIITSTLFLSVLCISIIGLNQIGLFEKNIQTVEENNIISETSKSEIYTEAVPSETTEIYYSKLVKNTEAPELDGYNNTELSLDIDGFDDSMILSETAGVIEGEIIDMWVNTYEYTTASDKFEPNGQMHHKTNTVAYKIRVDKVFSGEFSVGDEITIEDVYYILDSIISIKKGSSYVIPIYNWDGILYELDEIISGNNVLESNYSTYYQFHPQIEKVDGGYVVPSDWKSVINDECREIIMDIDENSYYNFYYVPNDIFDERMNNLLSK